MSIASDNLEVAGDFSKRSVRGSGSQPMAGCSGTGGEAVDTERPRSQQPIKPDVRGRSAV